MAKVSAAATAAGLMKTEVVLKLDCKIAILVIDFCLMKTEVVLKLRNRQARKRKSLCLMKTEVVLKYGFFIFR